MMTVIFTGRHSHKEMHACTSLGGMDHGKREYGVFFQYNKGGEGREGQRYVLISN